MSVDHESTSHAAASAWQGPAQAGTESASSGVASAAHVAWQGLGGAASGVLSAVLGHWAEALHGGAAQPPGDPAADRGQGGAQATEGLLGSGGETVMQQAEQDAQDAHDSDPHHDGHDDHDGHGSPEHPAGGDAAGPHESTHGAAHAASAHSAGPVRPHAVTKHASQHARTQGGGAPAQDAGEHDTSTGQGTGGKSDPPLTVGGHAADVSQAQRRVYKKHEQMIGQAKLGLAGYQGAANAFVKLWQKNRARYEKVAAQTGVPAKLIAAIHMRESSGNFHTYLHNGQPLGKPTTITPVGKFFTNWEDAAVDALKMQKSIRAGLKMNEKTTDMAAMATFAERYNGMGYDKRGRVSPYVYAGTDRYHGGKYDRDGHFNPNLKDQQLGVVAMLELISKVDKHHPTSAQPSGGNGGGAPASETTSGGASPTGSSGGAGSTAGSGDSGHATDLDQHRGAAAAKASHLLFEKGRHLYQGGTWETNGPNRGKLVDQIHRDNNADPKNGYAWCGMFVGANYAKAGVRKEMLRKGVFWSGIRLHMFLTQGTYINGKRSPWWQPHPHVDLRGKHGAAKKHAIAAFAPQPGDIVLFKQNFGHVGMVDGYDPSTGHIDVMEGNSGNRVRATQYDGETDAMPICLLGRLVPSDFEDDSHVDPEVADADDPKIHHSAGGNASTQ